MACTEYGQMLIVPVAPRGGWVTIPACIAFIIIHNCDFRQTFSEKLLKYIAIFIFEDIIFSKVCFYICIIEEPN